MIVIIIQCKIRDDYWRSLMLSFGRFSFTVVNHDENKLTVQVMSAAKETIPRILSPELTRNDSLVQFRTSVKHYYLPCPSGGNF